MLSYLGADARAAFLDQLDETARHRLLADPRRQHNAPSAVRASLRGAGRNDDCLLTMADPYLRWIASARHPADDFEWLAG